MYSSLRNEEEKNSLCGRERGVCVCVCVCGGGGCDRGQALRVVCEWPRAVPPTTCRTQQRTPVRHVRRGHLEGIGMLNHDAEFALSRRRFRYLYFVKLPKAASKRASFSAA